MARVPGDNLRRARESQIAGKFRKWSIPPVIFVEPFVIVVVIVADIQINQSQLKARTCNRHETRENALKRLSIVMYVFNVASFHKITQVFMSIARNRIGGYIIIMVNVEMYRTSKCLLSIFQVESCWTIARISSTFSWFEVRFSKM